MRTGSPQRLPRRPLRLIFRRRLLTTPGRALVLLCMMIFSLAVPAAIGHAEDSDRLRFYGALRVGDAFLPNSEPVSDVEA